METAQKTDCCKACENDFLDERDGDDGTSWEGTDEEWKQKYGILFKNVCTAPLKVIPGESVAQTRKRAKDRMDVILLRKRMAYQACVPMVATERPKGNHTAKLDRNQVKYYPAWPFSLVPIGIEEEQREAGQKRKREEEVTQEDLDELEELKRKIIAEKTKYDNDVYFDKKTKLQELYELARFPGNANDFYSVWPKAYWPVGQGIFISSRKDGESWGAYEIRKQMDIERLISIKKAVLERMFADKLPSVIGEKADWKVDPVGWQARRCKELKEQQQNSKGA